MSDTKDIIIQRVRSFFKNISWKKILTFLFFVLLASIFWIMQVYRENFETTLAVPVKYVDVPDSIVFDNDLPAKINVRIKDDGASLLKYYFTRKSDSLIIDVRDMIRGSGEKVIQGRALEQLIRQRLYPTTELISYTPTRILYAYEVLHEKKLPVIYDGYISLASGYLIDGELMIKPDSVSVYGSRSALDTLYYAHTVDDTLRDVTSDRDIHVAMRQEKGIRFVPNIVELSISVDEFNNKEVEVPVTCVNLPDNLNIKIFPSSVKIPFLVGLKRFNDISASDFEVIIDYNDIKDLKDSSVPLRITESPEYIQTKIPIPSEVEFVLERK